MKRLAIEIGICAVVVLASVVVSRVYIAKAERAENEAQMAHQDAQDAEDALRQAEQDKRVLEAVISKYDEAFLAADKQMREAIKDNVKRQQEIATVDPDWRADALPDGVRDIFADFICRESDATGGAAGTVRQADDGTP